MPQQHRGSWSNVLLLWCLATAILSPLCASSPTPTAAKVTSQDSRIHSTADSPVRWDPVCNMPMLPRYVSDGGANYYVGGGRDMWQDLQQSPVITTTTAFCISDRGAQCFCRKLGESSTIGVVDCAGHRDTYYPAWMHCQFHCTCPAPNAPNAPDPNSNSFSDFERYLSIHGLPWERTNKGA